MFRGVLQLIEARVDLQIIDTNVMINTNMDRDTHYTGLDHHARGLRSVIVKR